MFERTKRFLKKSIQTFKSYFSEGYEKLPKNPSYNGYHDSSYSLEKVYSKIVDQLKTTDGVKAISYKDNTNNSNQDKPSILIEKHEVNRRDQQKQEATSSREREEKRMLVTKRLKEMETLDRDNIENVLDIQEVHHFYSRLTVPVYCGLVEKFFIEIYSEAYSLLHSDNSTPRRISSRV